MNEIVVVGIAGFAAALVDGSLGMGFGPTSSSILLSSGISPVGVSATVNIAKVVTGLAGGVSHWRFGNVDWRLVRRLAIPGAFGALIGAVVLANVDGDRLRPMLAALLAVIGVRILVRFRQPIAVPALPAGSECPTPGVEIAGAVGGLTNGMIGAWGPVVTPYLLHRRIAPRIVVGSVNTAEIAVAFVAAGSLITSSAGVDPAIV
ncbi:MAG: sulfite exporter TauE/SafE family protein, partial [Ilumatobacter sp.]